MSGYLPAFNYYKDQVVAAGVPSAIGPLDGCVLVGPDAAGLSFTQKWTGTLGGTIKVEISSDPDAFPGNKQSVIDAAAWEDATAAFALTNPTSGGGNATDTVSDVRFEYLRISLTSTTGSGNWSLAMAGQDD
jgi:hypothetical protein